ILLSHPPSPPLFPYTTLFRSQSTLPRERKFRHLFHVFKSKNIDSHFQSTRMLICHFITTVSASATDDCCSVRCPQRMSIRLIPRRETPDPTAPPELVKARSQPSLP